MLSLKYLPVIFALLVGLTYYWSNKFEVKHKRYYHKIISFSAGVSITYLLLELLPAFNEAALNISQWLFVAVLIGFIAHHIIEKKIYLHNRSHELIRKLNMEENIFSFVYHVVLGIVLVTFIQEDLIQGVLFFISIISYTLVSTLPTSPHKSEKKAVFLSSSTLLGVLFSTYIWTTRAKWIEFTLIGLVAGVLLFTIIRHHIPPGRKGRIGYFTLGFVVYSILIILSWYI